MGKALGPVLSSATRDKNCSVWDAVLDGLNNGLDIGREKDNECKNSKRIEIEIVTVIETYQNKPQKQD